MRLKDITPLLYYEILDKQTEEIDMSDILKIE